MTSTRCSDPTCMCVYIHVHAHGRRPQDTTISMQHARQYSSKKIELPWVGYTAMMAELLAREQSVGVRFGNKSVTFLNLIF